MAPQQGSRFLHSAPILIDQLAGVLDLCRGEGRPDRPFRLVADPKITKVQSQGFEPC